MEVLKYKSDHNNVLQLDCFPVIRLDSGKYKPDMRVVVEVAGKRLGVAQCVQHTSKYFNTITDSMAFTLVGKPAAYLKEVLRKVYHGRGIDWQRQRISYMHFKWVERFSDTPVTNDARKPQPVQGTLGISCRAYQTQV